MAANIAGIVLGVALVFVPGVSQPIFNLLYFGQAESPFPPDAEQYIIFAIAILGAVMIGWLIGLMFVVAIPFRRGEAWAWWALALSVLTWLIPDIIMSIALGFSSNLLLNAVFVLLFGVPLLATYGSFHRDRAAAPAQQTA
jgi:hypothetical protein